MSLRNSELKYKTPRGVFTFHAFRPKAVNEIPVIIPGVTAGLLACSLFNPSRLFRQWIC